MRQLSEQQYQQVVQTLRYARTALRQASDAAGDLVALGVENAADPWNQGGTGYEAMDAVLETIEWLTQVPRKEAR